MLFIDIFGLVGTAAFSVSGVIVGINKKLDLFGVFVLAIITSLGGGLLRDVIIKENIPVLFKDERYFITAVLTAGFTCVAYKYIYGHVYKYISKLHYVMLVFDAIGLGIFTVLTAYKCITLELPVIGVMFLAVITGIGGGVLRDILVNDIPLVFRSEIYAIAALMGAVCFYLLYGAIPRNANIYLCVFITLAIRLLAVHFNVNVPVIKVKDDNEDK